MSTSVSINVHFGDDLTFQVVGKGAGAFAAIWSNGDGPVSIWPDNAHNEAAAHARWIALATLALQCAEFHAERAAAAPEAPLKVADIVAGVVQPAPELTPAPDVHPLIAAGVYPPDAPRCEVCGNPYSALEARAGMKTCERCYPPDHDPDPEDAAGPETLPPWRCGDDCEGTEDAPCGQSEAGDLAGSYVGERQCVHGVYLDEGQCPDCESALRPPRARMSAKTAHALAFGPHDLGEVAPADGLEDVGLRLDRCGECGQPVLDCSCDGGDVR